MDRSFPAGTVDRGRELIGADRATRLALGDLLVGVAPATHPDDTGADDRLERFAAALGINAAQARRYRAVSAALEARHRDALAQAGVSVGYEAISAALLRPGGSVELLLDVCRAAARAGRAHVSVQDVDAARRAVVKAEARQRRDQRASERAERAEHEKRERDEAFAAYRRGIDTLVSARLSAGEDHAEAERAVIREVAERIAADNGNPADLLSLGGEIIDRHADVIKTVRQQTVQARSATRRLETAESSLRRLAGGDVPRLESDELIDQWLATLDRIITNSVDLAERLQERRHGAQ